MTSRLDRVKRMMSALGLEVRLGVAHEAARVETLRRHGVSVVLDVGANIGQYVDTLRAFGYRGRVVSWEPVPAAFERLERDHKGPAWSGVRAAVGAKAGGATIHVTEDDKLSSLLRPSRIGSFLPGADEAGTITVPVVALDDVWDEHVRAGDCPALKVDVQGYEMHVLEGVARHLHGLAVIEVEVALTELYDGAAAVSDVLTHLDKEGFRMVSLSRGFRDRETGQVIDADFLFARPAKI